MSSTSDPWAPMNEEASAHGYSEDHDYGVEHGSLKAYLIGFGLSVVLTAIPFWLVMGDVLASSLATTILVLVLGVAQIYVHLVYFLHMDTSTEGGWQLMALSFTLILVVIVLVGSIWIMEHLHHNMMLTPLSG
ncbi:MAG: cytochrome o ubiquinol oxidase subunit IV [Salinisphaera sp.]|nr:cytochrome o ubiquinol oxidase subunit IV [Salinisphaera sp.]